MDKKDLRLLLSSLPNIKTNDLLKFKLKSLEIILNKYGGNVEDWYHVEIKSVHNLKKNTVTKVLYFYHVKNSGLETVKITCQQDKKDNVRNITHYKSFISFRNMNKINFYSEDKNEIIIESSGVMTRLNHINHLFQKFNDEKLVSIYNLSIVIEPFHRLLVRKFDEYCEQKYNKNQFSKADEIKKLKKLLDEGTISPEEFELFKKDLLT